MGYLSLSCSGVIPGSGYIGSPAKKTRVFSYCSWIVVAKKDESMYLPMWVLSLTGKPPKQGRRGRRVFSKSQRKKRWPQGSTRKDSLSKDPHVLGRHHVDCWRRTVQVMSLYVLNDNSHVTNRIFSVKTGNTGTSACRAALAKPSRSWIIVFMALLWMSL